MGVRKFSGETIQRACALREQGKSYAAIGAELGMSPGAVGWHCLRLGADSPRAKQSAEQNRGPMLVKRGGHMVRRFTPSEDAEILKMETAGATVSEIARALDRKSNSILGRLATLARRDARREAFQQPGQEGRTDAAFL